MLRAWVHLPLVLVSLGLVGCAAAGHAREPEPLRVPYAAMTHKNTSSPLAMYPMDDADYPRGERIALGPSEYSSISIYSEFTYDPQRIGPRRDGGYRYQYSWRQVLTVP